MSSPVGGNPLTDVGTFLSTLDIAKVTQRYYSKETIFLQGDPSDSVFFIQSGAVKLSVLSCDGKEAALGILSEGDFFGEGCLVRQTRRMYSATTIADCVTLRIEKHSMRHALQAEHAFSDLFMAHLLARNLRYEEDLVDQLFNNSEKRLARALLLLAHLSRDGDTHVVLPKISQETLAEMIGTTRSRVNYFMNRFRKMGFIDYSNNLEVRRSLANVLR